MSFKVKRHISIDKQVSSASESDSWSISHSSNAKIPRGLHCGPAGKKALIKWLEDNYHTSESDNPAVEACKIWQETQGFRDEVCKGYVGLLKLLGLPRNVTYKILFCDYLSKQFLELIERDVSQNVLMNLAKRMIGMFQVRQIQPLFAAVLTRLDDIPQDIMLQLVDNTPWANDFYTNCNFILQQKMWKYRPERFHKMISPLLRKITLLLAADAYTLSRLFDHNQVNEHSGISSSKLLQKPIIKQLNELANIIGKPSSEAQIRYDLFLKAIRFEFLNCWKSDSTISTVHCGYYSSIRFIFFEFYQQLHPNDNIKSYEPKSGFIGFLLLVLNLGPNNNKTLNLLRNKILLPSEGDPINVAGGRYRISDENDLFEVSMLFSSPHILLSITRTFGQSISNILDTTYSGHMWLGFALLGLASPKIGYAVRKLNNKLSRDCGGFYLSRVIQYIVSGHTKATELDPNTHGLNSLERFIIETVPLLDVNKLAHTIKFIHEYFECESYTLTQLKGLYKEMLTDKNDQDCRSIVLKSISDKIFKTLVNSSDSVGTMISHLLLLRIISVGWIRRSTCLVDVLLNNFVMLKPNDLDATSYSYLVSGIIASIEDKLYQPSEDIYTKLVDHMIEISQSNISIAMATAAGIKALIKIPKIRDKLNYLKSEQIAENARHESLFEEWTKLITL